MSSLELLPVDCERFRSGFLGQRVNALTSLVFVVVGLWILFRAFRRRNHGRTAELAMFGTAVCANAVGSVAYHGFHVWWGHWAHDFAILAVLLFIPLHDAAVIWGRSRVATIVAYVGGLSALGVTLALAPGSTDGLSAVLAAAAGVGEIAAWRRGFRPHASEGWTARSIAWLAVIVALVLGVAAFLLGRTGSPVCRPESLVQFHGLWHLFQAVVMGTYAYAAIELWAPVTREGATSP